MELAALEASALCLVQWVVCRNFRKASAVYLVSLQLQDAVAVIVAVAAVEIVAVEAARVVQTAAAVDPVGPAHLVLLGDGL